MNEYSSPLRWGILSTARINRALIKPLKDSKRNKLVAVASREREKAIIYANEWKIPKAYAGYEALLSDPDIDVIYNPLPNSLHAEWTIKAAQAGKHILCEKPLALSLDEVYAMKEAATKANVVIAEAFMYRHHPQTILVKEMVEAGRIGDLCLVRGSFTFNLKHLGDVRLNSDLGGGSIWDVGCYPISYTRMIFGTDPAEVFGWQWTGRGGVDEVFCGQMRFGNGVLAQFDCSFRSPYRVSMEVVGTNGTLFIANPFKPGKKEKIILHFENGKEIIRVNGQELYSGEVEDMADAILQNKSPRISLEDSAGNVATILALLQSAREGRPVAF